MLFVSGNSPHLSITQSVYDFFIERYEIASDVEVYHTNLSNKNAVGFTEMNGDEQFVQVHNKLNKEDFIVTLLHEFVHVMQNEQGLINETEREQQAYDLEGFFTTTIVPVRELSTNLAQTPKIVYLIGVEGTAPHHITNPLKSSPNA